MKIFDISLLISPDMPVWPGDQRVVIEQVSSMDAGAHDNVSRLLCSVHCGTHVDAPHHFLNDKRTVESLPLNILIGRARVIEFPEEVGLITAKILEKSAVPSTTTRLLLKTRNSYLWKNHRTDFFKDFVGISEDGAGWLIRSGIRLVGIDYLSIAPFSQGTLIHRKLLKPGMILLEGLDLSAVSPGTYDLYCLPLKLSGSDGAPARAILIDEATHPQGA
jgi:arylformamidase